MPGGMTEREISRQSIAWLRRQGCLCIKITANYRYGAAGWPDYLVINAAIKHGGCWFLEFKRPGNKPTVLQEQRMRQIREAGLDVVVSHSLEETQAAWRAR